MMPKNFDLKEIAADAFLLDEEQSYSCKHGNVVIMALLRSVLIALAVYFIYFVSSSFGANYYGLLAFVSVMIIESLYICIKRKGIDFDWYII